MPEKSGTSAVVGEEAAAYAAVLTAQSTKALKLDRVIRKFIELPFLWGRVVESRCDAVAVGRTYLFPSLSSAGALMGRPWLRFHTSLIEPGQRAMHTAGPLAAKLGIEVNH